MTRLPLYACFFAICLSTVFGSDAHAAFPLEHTSVDVQIAGPIAELAITQTFRNTNEDFIEATYVFPLQQDAAVDGAVMRIGEREIRAEIKERGEAVKIYEEARDAGKSAALTQAERPNIFTQKVANIPPGATIEVLLHVVQPLTYDDGVYRFELPMVVGPRFIPAGQPLDDAAAISPPVLPTTDADDQGIQHRVDLDLGVTMGFPLGRLSSPSHPGAVIEARGDEGELRLMGARADRDFVLEIEPRVREPLAGLIGQDGHFELLLEPPIAPAPSEVVPRELVFVVDTSCSMSGTPMDMVQDAMRTALNGMLPGDSFQIIRFDDAVSALAHTPLPATPENVSRGLAFVDNISGSGGTNMMAGVLAALDYPEAVDPRRGERQRIVALMTDGFIGNDDQILATISDHLGDSRVFAFGVGSSVNRYLLDQAAKLGRGSVSYVLLGQDPAEAVEAFYARIARPVLTDIRVDWGDLRVEGVTPEAIPDLYAGQPMQLFGRYQGAGPVVVTGRLGDRAFRKVLTMQELPVEEGGGLLPSAWARAHVGELSRQLLWGEDEEVKRQILSTALEYSILSPYTSFVAVERQIRNPAGRPLSLAQPVEIPAGVSFDGVFGSEVSRAFMRPGDPLLTVDAPDDALSVTAIFPWGEVAGMRWDQRRGRWYHRFLVPHEVADGAYHVQILIEMPDGELIERLQEIEVDSEAPELDASARPCGPNTCVRVSLDAPNRGLQVFPAGRPELRQRIDLRDPRYAGLDEIEITLPGSWDEVVIILKDLAMNNVMQTLPVTVDDEIDFSGEE